MNRAHTLTLALLLVACGPSTPEPDAGPVVTDGGFFADFAPPATQATANSLLITVSGEGAATEGFGFPAPAGSGEPFFLDGWELRFEHVLVTLASVTVNEGPDTNPNDPALTGPTVAEVTGPWAIDLAQPGPLDAKEQNGKAIPVARLTRQNRAAGTPAFDPTTRYALSYVLSTAARGPWNVNLDQTARAAYQQMAEKGWSVWLSGTATWRGAQSAPACRSTDTSYDFGRFPRVVKFEFGFAAPTVYRNCENPELSGAGARGVQTSTNTQTIAQLTFHLDHPFWEALTEDAPLRFDALAARKSAASGAGPESATLTTAELAFELQAPRDAQGAPVPWRTCGPVQPGERTTGAVFFDPVNVPVNPLGGAAGLADVGEYLRYNLSSFGHLNNDGLCLPDRQYPSPR